MSYDIEVFTKKVHHNENYTSNIAEMYYEAYSVAQKKEEEEYNAGNLRWKELTWKDFKDALNCDRDSALAALKGMIEALKEDPKKYKKMNPENGWGHYEGAVKFLEGAYKALKENPNSELLIDA